jgi:hypothetical protein
MHRAIRMFYPGCVCYLVNLAYLYLDVVIMMMLSRWLLSVVEAVASMAVALVSWQSSIQQFAEERLSS